MRALFTVEIGKLEKTLERHEALDALSEAMREEFPAYYISETVITDFVAAVVVECMPIAALDGEKLRPAHLNGWGHGDLTMKLVA